MTENIATDTASPLAPTPRPPLRRSTSDRVLGGVAGGFAHWLGIDPAIVRVVLVVLAIFGGSGVVLYVLGWLFIPEDGSTGNEASRLLDRAGRPGSSGRVVLIVMAVVAALILLGWISSSGPWDTFGGGSLLLLLVVGGTILWLLNRKPDTAAMTTGPRDATPGAEYTGSTTAVLPASAGAVGIDSPPTGFAYGGSGGGYPGYVPTPAPPPAPARERSYLGLAVLSVAIMVTGVLASINITGLADVPVVAIMAAGMGILGIGLIIGAFAGRAKWLISLALPLLLVTALVAIIPSNLRVGANATIGDRTWTPSTAAEALAPHNLGVGQAVLDLRELPTGTVLTEPIHGYVGIGDLKVIVPADMNVAVTANVGLGEIDLEGLPVVDGRDRTLVTQLPGSLSSTTPTVALVVEAGIGTLEVSRA